MFTLTISSWWWYGGDGVHISVGIVVVDGGGGGVVDEVVSAPKYGQYHVFVNAISTVVGAGGVGGDVGGIGAVAGGGGGVVVYGGGVISCFARSNRARYVLRCGAMRFDVI